MILLDLQQFAKSSSYMRSYRKTIREMKQKLNASKGSGESTSKRGTPEYKVGRLSDVDIRKDGEYKLYEVEDANDKNERPFKNAKGSILMQLIDAGRIEYNSKKHIWTTKKGGKYVIRKR